MMSKEEAEDLIWSLHEYDFLDELYNSIGSCICCSNNLYIDEELWCHTYQAPVNDNNFCSHFERKQDAN